MIPSSLFFASTVEVVVHTEVELRRVIAPVGILAVQSNFEAPRQRLLQRLDSPASAARRNKATAATRRETATEPSFVLRDSVL